VASNVTVSTSERMIKSAETPVERLEWEVRRLKAQMASLADLVEGLGVLLAGADWKHEVDFDFILDWQDEVEDDDDRPWGPGSAGSPFVFGRWVRNDA
jgi:diadenosine tetraphosphatase ApaH/serine/threonine PP2A family protein phosphatase